MDSLREKVIDFISVAGVGSGSGYGYGTANGTGFGAGANNGSGNGIGAGHGYGNGIGVGYGNGTGFGAGTGTGSGIGHSQCNGIGVGYDNDSNVIKFYKGGCIKRIDDYIIHYIDNIATIIVSVRNNIAKGFVVCADLTLKKCYVAKDIGMFAHGETARCALESLRDKIFAGVSKEDRIAEFVSQHTGLGKQYPNESFYKWHGLLTGSCKHGRDLWIKERGINLSDKMTLAEFIRITKDEYGGDIMYEIEKILKEGKDERKKQD